MQKRVLVVLLALAGALLVAGFALWLLGGCNEAQRRVISAHEIRVEEDCKRIEANPLTPNVVRLTCDTGDLVIDISSTTLDLLALDGGNDAR